MKIAFKKKPRSIAAYLICFWTRSKHYHSELIFDDGRSFSAIAEKNKTMFRNISFPEDSWDIFDLNLTEQETLAIERFCLEEDNCGYDWTGIFMTQILPFSWQSKTRWFCSELCLAALQEIGWFENLLPYEYAPNEVLELIKEKLND